MRTDFHSRRRIAPPSRTVMRREPCHVSWPARLADRVYIGHADETGTWSLYVNGDLLMITAGPDSARTLAAAMLADAFPAATFATTCSTRSRTPGRRLTAAS